MLCPVTTCGAGKSEIYNFWWLISVTLVVDWLFCPEILVWCGDLRRPFAVLWMYICTWGGGSIYRWWGHLNPTCHNWTFWTFALGGGGEWKTSSNCMGKRPCTQAERPRAQSLNEPPGETFNTWFLYFVVVGKFWCVIFFGCTFCKMSEI